MTDPHKELREQLGVVALGHGTPAERAAVLAHVEGCAQCRAELAELTPLRGRLDLADPDRLDERPPVPDGLRDAVLGRIAAEQTTPARRAPRTRQWVAAAAVAAGVAGVGVGWLVRPVPDPGPLQAVGVQVVAADVAARADVVPHTWGLEVRLQGDGFTAGEVYRVQVTEDGGGVVPAGQFLGVGPGSLDCNLSSSVLPRDASGFQVLDSAGDLVVTSTF